MGGYLEPNLKYSRTENWPELEKKNLETRIDPHIKKSDLKSSPNFIKKQIIIKTKTDLIIFLEIRTGGSP
jgi:hypothetical protein